MAAHDGLVQWVVRRQWRGDLAFDEAVQIGRIGLWHALRGYDPARGNRFSTYAVPAITHAVWAAVATPARETRDPEPRAPSRVADGNALNARLDLVEREVVVLR